MTTTAGHKRRWSARIGTMIRRTSKSHRAISFDQDAEFVPRSNYNESGNLRLPHLALDIHPTLSGALCTIAESPLREAEATRSATGLLSGRPVYELNTLSSESSISSQALTNSPELGTSPISQTGEISIISPATTQDLPYHEPQATEINETKVSRSESADEVSAASCYEMAQSNIIHHLPSNSSLSTTSGCQLHLDLTHFDTSIPLFAPYDTLETAVSTHSSDENIISWVPCSASSDKLEKLHAIGWLEYRFPNGNVYYFHPERKISTEVDLANDPFLELAEKFWQEHGIGICGLRRNLNLEVTLNGFIEDEIWLKDIGLLNNDSTTMFEMWRVDHVARTMVLASQEINNNGASTVQENQIDMEHRYWAFMQSHPAHTVLPSNAKSAAINTLAWAWTDHLLSLRRSDSIPFTREECRDLMTLLQSLIVEKNHHQAIQTCIVARVFLQVAQWHKSHQCDKASSTDTSISISLSISESSNRLPKPMKLEKSWIVRHLFLDLVIFISIFLFTFLFAVGLSGLVFTQVQVFLHKIIGLLGRWSTSLPILDWNRTLEWSSGLKDTTDMAI